MTENRRLYLPGSELDGLTVEQAQVKANRAAAQQQAGQPAPPTRRGAVRGASDRARGDGGRNQARSPAGNGQRSRGRRAAGNGGGQRTPRRKPAMLSALVRVQILQLLAVLGAIVTFYLAFQCGWI